MYEYLAHHGIKGQRWGIRRFQRKDGTRTPAGKKRYDSDGVKRASNMTNEELKAANARMTLEKNYNKLNGIPSEHKTVMEVARDSSREATNAINSIKNTHNKLSDNTVSYKKMNLQHMTNKELQDAITRYNLEAQYTRIYGQQNINRGRENVAKALEIGGTITATAASALSIALMIKQLQMKHSDFAIVDEFLAHHGIKGQKWGVRRYQNENGTLTAAGKKKSVHDNKTENSRSQRKKVQKMYSNWHEVYNQAADKFNSSASKSIQAKYKNPRSDAQTWEKYVREYAKEWNMHYTSSARKLYGDAVSKYVSGLPGYYGEDQIQELIRQR